MALYTRAGVSGESSMWCAVLYTAIDDMFSGRKAYIDEARSFLLGGSAWYRQVCDMAGIDHLWLHRKIKEAMDDPETLLRVRKIIKFK